MQVPLPDEITAKIAKGFDDPSRFPAGQLTPALPAACNCGAAYSQAGYCKIADCRIYLTLGSVTRPLLALDCPNRQQACRRIYDGAEHALWVVTPTTAFSLPVLYMCLEHVRS